MSVFRTAGLVIGLCIVLTVCGSSYDSPVIRGENLHEIGKFAERCDLLTPDQKLDLKIAVPYLMTQ